APRDICTLSLHDALPIFAWMFVTEQKASEQALEGGIEFGKMPPAPGTLPEVIAAYERSSQAFVERIKKTPEAELNKTVKFFVARSEEHTSELQSRSDLVC